MKLRRILLGLVIVFIMLFSYDVFAEGSWKTEDNNTYYVLEDGTYAKGITEIDGKRYLFGITSGKLYKNGFATITSGETAGTYYTDTNGVVKTGWATINGAKYYFDSIGRMQKGVTEIDGKRYLLGITSGKLYKNGFATITSGETAGTYYTDKEGIVTTGWATINRAKYYFDSIGRMQKGVTEIDGKRYLLGITSGKLYTSGYATITSGETAGIYYTDGEGIVTTGWTIIDKAKYYFDSIGRMQKGITEVDGKRYLLGITSGKLYTSGFATVSSGETAGTYYTDTNGVVKTGWQTIDKAKYYFDSIGRMQKGIVEIDGSRYLFGITSGKLYTSGFATISTGETAGTYYTDTNGVILIGWQTINNEKYYFDSIGRMQKGVAEIDGKKYLFGFKSGKLYYGWATAPNKDIYHTNQEGIIDVGEKQIDGKPYVFNENGVLQTGWRTIDGKTYYFYSDGSRARYISKIAGKRYEFTANGELQYSDVKVVIDVSKYNGVIDWDKVWDSGEIDGAIIRISAGAGFSQLDPFFERNLNELKRLNIPYGVYIYSYAENYDEGVFYGNFTNQVLRKYEGNPSLGIYFDLEENGIVAHLSTEEWETVVKGYMGVCPSAKIYTYTYFLNTKLNTAYLRNLTTWIANYAVTDRPGDFQGWQYTSKGRITGVTGDVDISIFYS